jgi:hypothetical protein
VSARRDHPALASATDEDATAMPTYLIVANQTLGGLKLAARLSELTANREESSPVSLQLLVPVTETDGTHQWDYPPIDRYVPDALELAKTLAQARLEHELQRLTSSGVKATGEVTGPDPVDRVKALVASGEYEAVVVSTLPKGLSRWLHRDLPHRLSRALDIPVIHVEGSAGPSL